MPSPSIKQMLYFAMISPRKKSACCAPSWSPS
jgi:hypothetical protein